MTQILFFDTDKITLDYLKEHPVEGREVDYFDFDFNSDRTKMLVPKDAEVISIFAHGEMLKNEMLDLFPNLKLIATRSTGFNHIDLEYAKKRGITVCNVPNYGEVSVAEYTMGLMLGLSRKIYPAKSDMKRDAVQLDKYIGMDLNGRTLGVIGTGAIGRAVVRLAMAFGMKVVAFDPYPSDEMKKIGVSYVALDELFVHSDVITIHAPATKENTHMLNKDAFDKMKRNVLIINTARGTIIDSEAIYFALRSGRIAGAALDVLESEDILTQREVSMNIAKEDMTALVDSVINMKLMQLDNVIITPHIAFNSMDAVHRILEMTLDNINGFLTGAPVHVVK